MRRRRFIQKISRLFSAGVMAAVFPPQLCAAWPAEHFSPGDFITRFRQLFDKRPIVDSDAITITLPEMAENGAVVPITISSDLEEIQRIYIWVENNPTPLAAEFELDGSVAVYLTARIKMAESSHVVIIAEQADRLLRAQQWVKVMQGGCGTG